MKTIDDLPHASDLAKTVQITQNKRDEQEMAEIVNAIDSAASRLQSSVEVSAVSPINQLLLARKGYKVRNKSTGMNEYAIEISWV